MSCQQLRSLDQILDLYRDALEEDAGRIEPLTYVTKGLEFPIYSQEKASYLSQIAAAIVSASAHADKARRRDNDPAINLYSKIRGDYIASSLEVSALGSVSTSKRRSNDTVLLYGPETAQRRNFPCSGPSNDNDAICVICGRTEHASSPLLLNHGC